MDKVIVSLTIEPDVINAMKKHEQLQENIRKSATKNNIEQYSHNYAIVKKWESQCLKLFIDAIFYEIARQDVDNSPLTLCVHLHGEE